MLPAVTLTLVLGPSAPLAAQGPEASDPHAVLARQSCADDDRTILFGRLHDAATEVPLPGGSVYLTWRMDGASADTVRRRRETRASASGQFTFCDPPTDVPLVLGARVLDHPGQPRDIRLSPGELRREDVGVSFALTTGAVSGTLHDAGTGEPIGSATVAIPDLQRSALSDGLGRFRLEDVRVGRYPARIRHVAYGTQSVMLDVQRGHVTRVRIDLHTRAVPVEPLVVMIDLRPRWLEDSGFYHRRARGLGSFVGPGELERQNPQRLNEILRRLEGLQLRQVCTPYCYYVISTHGRTRFDFCPPQFFVDGESVTMRTVADLESLANANDVAAVEVYRGISQTPPEFFSTCGSVVIWTKRGAG